MEYARKLKVERVKYADTLEIVMRVYFEKPRTTVGWKGLINDPYLDESFRIHEGLRIARQLLVDINRLGVPAASEFLDTISPQYIGDLISWGAIGARTTESRRCTANSHRGCRRRWASRTAPTATSRSPSTPFRRRAKPHHFLSVHKNGQVAIVETRGNKDCHVILRGGKQPNYDAASVAASCTEIEAAKLPCRLDDRHQPRQQRQAIPAAGGRGSQTSARNSRPAAAASSASWSRATSKPARKSSPPARTIRRNSPTVKASPMAASAGAIRWRCIGGLQRRGSASAERKSECVHATLGKQTGSVTVSRATSRKGAGLITEIRGLQ